MFHKKTAANFITGIFAILLIAQIFGFLITSIENNTVSAKFEQGKNPLDNLQVKIPGLEDLSKQHPVTCTETGCSVPWIGVYITAIYNYAIGSVGILATVVLMYAGMLWITAAGNTEQISKAKSYITASLTGLVLTLTSWTILYQVNPDLINFKAINIVPVDEKLPKTITSNESVCCLYPSEQNSQTMLCQNVTADLTCIKDLNGTPYRNQTCTLNERSWSCGSFVVSAQKETAIISSDFEARGEIESYGYSINKTCNSYANQTSGTCFNDLPIKALSGLKTIREGVDKNTEIWITGGTEMTGHATHGPGKAIVDIRICSSGCTDTNTELIKYINGQLGQESIVNTNLTSTDGKITVRQEINTDGSKHFHIIFN